MNRQLLGKGMTAEVYEWDQQKILKLYYPSFPHSYAEYEYRIGTILNNTEAGAPFCHAIIDQENRKGILFEWIEGEPLLQLLGTHPLKIKDYGKEMARTHFRIHQISNREISSQKERFTEAVLSSSGELGDFLDPVLGHIEKLEMGNSLCHGDFHPGNILVDKGTYRTIDWMNTYSGNPLGDVARTLLMIRSPFLPDEVSFLIKILARWAKFSLAASYLNEYIKNSGFKKSDLNPWFLPVAAARLREQIPGERKWLLKLIRTQLQKGV